ncbi:unnamed protein product [Rangifer tarandus platyrhynchus]|uniref:Uncharacterized protein n=1 Tax=Rangifer tarandus platyrhynchus TaxID=3082113 RepID=A0ABN8YBQ2_RANTA|nr:unnamed protein product [Rangifer tarandus platyrhynchus]
MGALSIGYAQHRLGEGLACGSSSSLSNQLSLPPEEREGRDRDFFLHKRKKKKKLSFLLWWWFDRIFLVSLEALGLKFLSSRTQITHMDSHIHTQTHILGITGCPGPSHPGFNFCWSPEIPFLPSRPDQNLAS